jgi:hypothetical protein
VPPVPGKPYAVGDELGPGVTIVAVSGPEVTSYQTFTEVRDVRPGLVRYVAWGFDDLYNYGPPAGDFVIVDVPPQTANITINPGTGTVSVSPQPSYSTISGNATLSGSTLTVTLDVRNETTRLLYAPKLVVTSAIAGATWTNSDGTLEATPYRAYGAAIAPGTSASRSWELAGADASTPVTFGVALRDNPVMVGPDWFGPGGYVVDAATGQLVIELGTPVMGQGSGSMALRGGFTPDGQLLMGGRTAGVVNMFDVATGNRVMGVELRPQKSYVPVVVLDRSGSAAYALVTDGHPYRLNNNGAGGGKTELVRLDAATLTESGRLDLGIMKPRSADLSADGRTLVVASGLASMGVVVVDLVGFEIKHRILPGFRAVHAVLVPQVEGGISIAVVGEQVSLYSLDGTRTATYPTPGTGQGRVLAAVLGPSGKLWIARRDTIVSLDLSNGDTGGLPSTANWVLSVSAGKLYAWDSAAPSGIKQFDEDGTLGITLTGLRAMDSHWIGHSPF